MIISKAVITKWHASNKKYYVSRGYVFTKVGDKLEVKVEHLMPLANIRILAKCDKCGKIREVIFYAYRPLCHSCAMSTKETKKKMSKAQKGKKHSEKTKKKISEINKGKKLSKEHRKKLSEALKGDKNPNWNSNITDKERESNRDTVENTNWRETVFERDNYICQICKKCGGNLVAHHLNAHKSFSEQRYDIFNGITLCKSCHKAFGKAYKSHHKGTCTKEEFEEFQDIVSRQYHCNAP